MLPIIIGLAILTDWLDGFLARRLSAVSSAGKLLDPLADALFCMLVFVDFARHGLMPTWIVALLIAREALVTFVLRPVALRGGVVIAARPLGKVKTGFQFAAMLVVAVGLLGSGACRAMLQPAVAVGFLVVLVLSLTSGGFYVFDLARSLRKDRVPGE